MSRVRAIGARSRSAFTASLLVLAAVAAAALGAPPRAHADDAEWKARVSKSLGDVEVALALLDRIPPMPAGSLAERAAKLSQRMIPLETEAGIAPGSISGKDTLFALSSDAASLNTRLQRLIAARNAAKNPKQAPPPPPGLDVKPAKPVDPPADPKPSAKKDPKAWPSTFEFSIGARITYFETGSWVPVEVKPNVYEDRFLMDGYSASLSFSMRTKGLLANIKSARVRVAVRVQGPLTQRSDLYRVYEVDWVAENVMNNESKANWMKHDTFAVRGDMRYVTPRTQQMTPEAHAHVLSVTLPDGTTKTFEAPKYATE